MLLCYQVISSPAFTNNEYLICQNLVYVDGNTSLPVYQAAELVTDVRAQFMKVLVLALTASVLMVVLLVVSVARFPLVSVWQAIAHSVVSNPLLSSSYSWAGHGFAGEA